MSGVSYDKTAGYFAWVRTLRGQARPEKYNVDRRTLGPESTHYFENVTICSFRLNEEEFSLPLDELAKRYPLPQENKQ